MQISTTKERIVSHLALVAGAADTRGTIPMLGMVLLKTTNSGQLSLLCSDTGMLARALSPCEIKSGGEIAVDVRRLHDLIRAVPDKQDIEISVEGKGTLLVKSGRSRFRLPTLAAADYPRMVQAKGERMSITMAAHRLSEMIGDVSSSMSSADLRIFLNGALFSFDKDGLWLVSTDGSRMVVSHEPIQGADTLAPRNVIVPRKSALLAKKLLAQGGNVTLTIGAKDVQFTFEDSTVLLANGIDGAFPNWRVVIPATKDTVDIATNRLRDALSMLGATIEDGQDKGVLKKKVEITFANGLTAISRGEAGRCEVDSASTSNTPCEIGFNIDFLSDAVNTIGSSAEGVRIGYSGSAGAITVRPKDREYPLAVVMPLRS